MGKNDLTQGNAAKVLLRFAAPFLAANLIQALYGAADLAVVGWFCGSESVAAVSTGTQVTQIITSVISGLTLGGTIRVGQLVGRGQQDKTGAAVGTLLTAFVIFAAGLTAALLGGSRWILQALQTPEAAFAEAMRYVCICAAGVVFICGYNAVSAVLRGYGDSVRPMLFVALACVLNIAGDLLLVGVLRMGAAGAAVATAAAQGFSMVCGMVYLHKSRFPFRFGRETLRIRTDELRRLAGLGLPITIQECMVRLSFLYLTSVTNRLGVAAAAAVGVASRYDVLAMLPATSVASALAAVTAQNFGAGKPQRAALSLKLGLAFALAASGCFFAWAQLSPETMIGLFSREADVIEAGIPFFRSCSWDYLAVSVVFCLNGYLNGRECTVFTMISCCFGALCLRMPLIWLAYGRCADDLAVLGAIAPAVSGVMAVYTLAYVAWMWRKDRRLSRQVQI